MRHANVSKPASSASATVWVLAVLGFVVCVAIAFALGVRHAATRADIAAQEQAHDHDHPEPAEEEEGETWWTCSMHPDVRQPDPGLCPICNMDLIPIREDPDAGEGTLRRFATSEEAKKLMEIQTAEVRRERPVSTVRLFGTVEPDETRLEYATAWFPGRIDRLHVGFTGAVVNEGDPLAVLYSPQLMSAQEELLQAKQSAERIRDGGMEFAREMGQGTVEAARERLRLFGLRPEQIAEIEERGTASEHVTIHSPASGVVLRRRAQQGLYVSTGERLYDVADLSRVWVQFDAYESDLPWVKLGQDVAFRVEGIPGERFEGVVTFVQPVLDPQTRTAKVRVEAANPEGILRPDMFARGEVRAELGDEPRLLIPATAPLVTGERAVVYVEVPDADRPTFEGREIVLGPRANDMYVVRHGLAEGDRVVTHGAFKIDSALQIRARPSMMTPEPLYESVDDPHALAQFWRELAALRSKREQVERAIAEEDLEAAREAFRKVGSGLHEVDAAPLVETRALRVWAELSMMIENDAFLGGEAGDLRAASRYAEGLARRMERLRAAFEPPEEREARARREAARAAAIQREVAERLAPALKAYIPLQQALVADEEDDARQAVAELSAAVEALDPERLPSRVRTQWSETIRELKEAVEAMRAAADNAERTVGFSKASDALADLARTFGTGDAGVLHRVHCPMAFDDAGADWLQVGTAVRNPYFAGGMLECGVVLEALGDE